MVRFGAPASLTSCISFHPSHFAIATPSGDTYLFTIYNIKELILFVQVIKLEAGYIQRRQNARCKSTIAGRILAKVSCITVCQHKLEKTRATTGTSYCNCSIEVIRIQ